MIVVNRATACGFCGALLASIGFLSSLFAQTTASNLVEQFENTTVFWEQFEIAKQIGALHDKSVLPRLEPWLSCEDMHRRGNAAFVFASVGDDRGFQVIKAILENRSPKRAVFRTDSAGNPSPELQIREDRYYAAHLFGDLKDSRAVPILIPLLKDQDVNSTIPWSLGEIGDKLAIPPLIETLDDNSPDMRVLAIYALEKLKATEALPQIRGLQNDDEKIHFDGLGTVAEAAKAAVANLEAVWPQTSNTSNQRQTVSIVLPKDTKSETVQIRYMLTGPFGGYASYVNSRPDLHSYEIDGAVQGQAAQTIRILVYASGCRFQTLVLAFSGKKNLQDQFVCRPLPTVKLKGRVPGELVKNENAKLVAVYTAYWAQDFFGIMDGFVTQFEVAEAKPDANGSFEIEIPDFAEDMHSSSFEPSATLGLGLRDSRTLNPIARNLEPELPEFRTQTNTLRIEPTYPSGMRFLPTLR